MTTTLAPALSTARPTSLAPPLALDPVVLGDIATRISHAEWMWRSVVRHDPEARRPVRLLATPAYEVWVIGWTTGQSLELHDHGDAAGVVVVLEGRLRESFLEGGTLVAHDLAPGQVRVLPEGTVHAVANPDTAPATSLHVYSPPLSRLTKFDPSTLEVIDVQPVDETAPLHSSSTASMLLHLHADG